MFLLRNRKCKSVTAKNGITELLNANKLNLDIAFQRTFNSQVRKSWNFKPSIGSHNSLVIRNASTNDRTKNKQPDGKYASCALPSECNVVICGGGVMGAAVGYHLALLGLGPQTIILEQGR